MAAYTKGLDLHHDLRHHVDGFDYYEFAAAMLSRNQTIRDDRLKEVFEHMDEDKKGFIDVANLEHIMGSKAHAEEIMGELKDAVSAAGGRLTFQVLKDQIAKVPSISTPSLPGGAGKTTIMTASL